MAQHGSAYLYSQHLGYRGNWISDSLQHLDLHSEFQDSKSYMVRLFIKNKTKYERHVLVSRAIWSYTHTQRHMPPTHTHTYTPLCEAHVSHPCCAGIGRPCAWDSAVWKAKTSFPVSFLKGSLLQCVYPQPTIVCEGVLAICT